MKTPGRLLLALTLAGAAFGQDLVLHLESPDRAAAAGAEVSIDLVALNPAATAAMFEPPRVLAGMLFTGGDSRPVELRIVAGAPVTIAAHGFTVCAYRLALPDGISGRAILEVSVRGAEVSRAVIAVQPGGPVRGNVAAAPLTTLTLAKPAGAAIQRSFTDRLGFHEPIYFIYGPDAPAAKFQFSFKYRLLNFSAGTAASVPKTLQFGYTQRSLWDIAAASSPFYDTSYMPELIFESLAPAPRNRDSWFTWIGYQAGYKHESNGRDGPSSRSLNTLYLRPAFAFGPLDRWHLLVIPEVFTYVSSLSDNPDLRNYRGYGQLRLVLGTNTGPSLMFTGLMGKNFDHPTLQFDLTVPIRTHLLDFGSYFLVQYFNGYGESLLNYRQKSATVRAGLSFVR